MALHELGTAYLDKTAKLGYAPLPLPLCRQIAQRSVLRCVAWTLDLVESEIENTTNLREITDALAFVREGIANPTASLLPRLDEMAWQAWVAGNPSSADFDIHPAIAGLIWATIGALITIEKCPFESVFVGIKCEAIDADAYGTELVVRECCRSLSLVLGQSAVGRQKIAEQFSSEMEKPE